ncbi:hypothetical protein GCM10018793_43090 [Streptomyces sulfonofaciens]|uniref:Uncharacterized protein n=1 Tax=Streptomyces sulfonofaciens TaxID=68272 RepID=A0A919GDX3_9ACTN|nr:hypothetical protein [Streptomyces sulfonofaciens]GHH82745.1 hypothetical protein GCM10018793_43090 [Streptomyces sulfonofaciens]
MTSQGRSAGSVVCIVFAVLSLVTAVIVAVTALTATSHVSDEPQRPNSAQPELFQDPACGTRPDTAPDQVFLACLSDSESQAQEDAAFWGAETAARQADARAKGDLAIIFGLIGLAFAVCAGVFRASGRSVPRTAAPAGAAPGPGAAQGTVPLQ